MMTDRLGDDLGKWFLRKLGEVVLRTQVDDDDDGWRWMTMDEMSD
jgi:hypothetical protein